MHWGARIGLTKTMSEEYNAIDHMPWVLIKIKNKRRNDSDILMYKQDGDPVQYNIEEATMYPTLAAAMLAKENNRKATWRFNPAQVQPKEMTVSHALYEVNQRIEERKARTRLRFYNKHLRKAKTENEYTRSIKQLNIRVLEGESCLD